MRLTLIILSKRKSKQNDLLKLTKTEKYLILPRNIFQYSNAKIIIIFRWGQNEKREGTLGKCSYRRMK